ncbi:short-chain dehydrogenase [Basidiobolus meristosporus CBS 931.73]|uniref:Short-chain dehydrogenase n=1 Tax=Basidiobolus meristosporus CBS 931.73 TaxID=1314790 RepID=A0A1Y1XZJ6_9FUNG|nr:short-chain dehydrogenase [Basidiobolus meristosporus CBS 931.73]|eukprot:ORX91161.1 short-chain dehydrogenase [Basidiobolus meristosporus CBS 931.73]
MTTAPVVIITGASRGIGRAIALDVLKLGGKVMAVARSEAELKKLQEEAANPESVAYLVGDLTEDAVVKKVVEETISNFGRVTSVVLNAGVIEPVKSIATSSIEEWKKLFDINFFSVLSLVQQSLPHLRKTKGNLVMVSSGAGYKAYEGWSAYCCSKAAINMLALSVSKEETDVKSIAVRPGAVDTDMQKTIRELGVGNMAEYDYSRFVTMKTTSTLVKPEDCGYVMAKLAVQGVPADLNGEFVSWDDVALKDYRRE